MQSQSLAAFLAAHPQSVLVEIAEAKGSTPREEGAVMLVAEHAAWGTIGGGQLEFMATDNARAMLAGGGEVRMNVPLGPEIGQCCGGRTLISFRPVTPPIAAELQRRLAKEDRARPAVFLFGAGHVGLALARALVPLPLSVTVVETRAEALRDLPGEVTARHAAMPEALVADIPAGGAAVIATGRSDFPNQINNVLAFPGVFRGTFDVRASDINDEMKLAAAYALAGLIEAKDLNPEYIIPAPFDPRVRDSVAKAVAQAARDSGVARI